MTYSKEHFEEIDFYKYWLVMHRRWLPATGVFGLCLSLVSWFTLSSKPLYDAKGELLIKTDNTSSLTGLGKDKDLGKRGELKSVADQFSSPVTTQAKIITSVPVLEETINELGLKDGEGKPWRPDLLRARLKVAAAPETDILQITYTAGTPKFAANVVNKLMEIYIRNNIEVNRAEAVAARKFIQKQLPRNEAAVREAESALRRFKEQNKVISLQQEASSTVSTIANIENQITAAQTQLVDVTAKSQKLLQEVNIDSRQAVAFASLSQVPGIQTVLTQLQETESQLATEQNRYQPEHPTLINLQEKADSLRNLLQTRIQEVNGSNQQASLGNLQIGTLRQNLIADFVRTETERLGLEQQVNRLFQVRSFYKQRANILPKLEQRQRELERRLTASQNTYETLLSRLQEINVAENQNIGNARIISSALVPEKPNDPRIILKLLAGGIGGILLGVMTAFALDLIDRSIKTAREARELFQYTLLGVIPSLSPNSKKSLAGVDQSIPKVIGRDIPQFPVGDSYQMLQANLKFLSDRQLKAIAVTSSVPKEGKSSVSTNLAVAMAQVGRRVLLIDADMRRPTQHHIWEVTNTEGLSNIIVDEVPLETAVRQVMPNLYLLPSGVIPPNSIALLDSQRMSALINIFTQKYDCVIFDTPPLAGTADAGVLGKLADGILLVARPGVVDFNSANAAKEFLTQSGQNVLGMVINGVNAKSEPEGYFYYNQESIEPKSISRSYAGIRKN